MTSLTIAVEGCCHGELDDIYETLSQAEIKKNIKIDLLICCGDFEAVRNQDDLNCMAVPPKYRHMKSYHRYYSGERVAPILTIFISGNHEAVNHMHELYYGGWVAPNIYYMGYAGVLNFRGVRIGGLSGIYKKKDYYLNHFEYPPYNESTIKSSYHVRQLEVERLKMISEPIDIFLSHDWPHGIALHGDHEQLIRFKPFFKDEIYENNGKILGNPPAMQLLEQLRPTYWFSGHMHCKFAALYKHKDQIQNRSATKFLALDKCLPGRKFLQILNLPGSPYKCQDLQYDLEWLKILKATHHWLQWSPSRFDFFGLVPQKQRHLKESSKYINEKFHNKDQVIPQNFIKTIPTAQSELQTPAKRKPNQASINFQQQNVTSIERNPQTLQFLSMLDLAFNLQADDAVKNVVKGLLQGVTDDKDALQSDVDEEEQQMLQSKQGKQQNVEVCEKVDNPEEINLDDL